MKAGLTTADRLAGPSAGLNRPAGKLKAS
jgi:hypothetical protein